LTRRADCRGQLATQTSDYADASDGDLMLRICSANVTAPIPSLATQTKVMRMPRRVLILLIVPIAGWLLTLRARTRFC